jgi:hypothetical protein
VSPVQLPGGLVGYGMERTDQCMPAALATVLQVPIERVPDPRLDDQLDAGRDPDEISRDARQSYGRWLDDRGLALVYHETLPVDRERWIGVCEYTQKMWARNRMIGRWHGLALDFPRPEEAFMDHCLVMSFDRLLFDPAIGLPAPPGTRLRHWRPDEITYGLTVDRKD